MSPIELSIIIINFNVDVFLRKCLQSVTEKIKGINFEIIVIDNNSQVKSIENLNKDFINVNFHFLDENLGFSKANNYGVAKSTGEYLLFLNPDTILLEDCVSPMIKFINNGSFAGLCAPMLLNGNKTFQVSYYKNPGIVFEIMEAFMLIKIYRKIKYYIDKKSFILNSPVKKDVLSGAFMLMKRTVFDAVNGFNENYFLNYEDFDICRRVINMGYSNYYFPSLKCIHLSGQSFRKDYTKLTFSRYQSRLVYAKNFYSDILQFIVKLIHILGLLFRIILVRILYSGKEAKDRFNGYKQSLNLYIRSL